MNAVRRTTRTATYAVTVLTTLAGLVFVAAPAHAAVHQAYSDGVIYTYDDANPDAGAVVTDYQAGSNQHMVSILDTVNIDGVGVVPVKGIAHTADFKDLTSVWFIGENLLSIGNNVFANNALTTVDIPDSVTSIGEGAFFGNSLTTVTIGEGVTSIGTSAFYGNPLTNVRIPDSVTSIGSGAFGLNTLTHVVIGSGVTSIGDNAFDGNSTLTSVKFAGPAPTVTGVGPGQSFDTSSNSLVVYYRPAFAAGYTPPLWHGYTTAPYGVTTTINGISYSADETDIPAGAKVTGYDTASGLNVTIPSTVSILGQSYNVTEIGASVFRLKGLTQVTLPGTLKYIGPSAFQNNELGNVTIPNSVTAIGELAFDNSGLTAVTISNGMAAIETHTFGHNEFTNVTIPSGVRTIDAYAFESNPLLTTVTIGVDIYSIAPNAFLENDALTSVRFLGPAPAIVTDAGSDQSFDTQGVLVVYYRAGFGAQFASPWHGYTTKPYLSGLAPTITGTVRETYTLTAHPGPVDAQASVNYQWKANGANIVGATNPTLKLAKAQAGRRITVTATATFQDAEPLVKTSATTRVVSSPYKRIVLSKSSVKSGTSFRVTATGFKAHQTVRIRLNNVTRYSGRADAYGVVDRTVSFTSGTPYGWRSVKVQYKSGGTWHTGISTSVKYYR